MNRASFSRFLASVLLVCFCVGGSAPAAPQQGVSFDGKSAYRACGKGSAVNPKAMTVSAWVKLAHVPRSQVFVNSGCANTGFTFYQFHDRIRMLIAHKDDAYTHANAPVPALDTWTHLAGTYDGEQIQLYVAGKPVSTTPAAGKMHELGRDLFLGALDQGGRFLKGEMADIRLWNRVLNDDEVAAVFRGEASGRLTEGLIGHWTRSGLKGGTWASRPPAKLTAKKIERRGLLINEKDEGYRGIWYYNQPSNDEYVYKYSGGLGTYCAKHIPHAFYVQEVDKTFFTYGGTTKESNRKLIHMVSYYDHKTGMVPRPTILLDKKTSDAHDNPVISVDDEGYIWIFSSSHGTSRPSYISRSSKPYSIERFELMWTGNYSYPQPWFVPGKGFLLMHTYYLKGRTNAIMTSQDGRTWSDRRLIARIAQGHYQSSRPFKDVKVGTAFNYHPAGKGLNWRTNLYYMETHDFGQTWQSITGVRLEPMITEIKNPALAVEYESKGLNVYLKDVSYDAKGNPIILYVTSKGYESGPENMPRTWTTARWTGSAWDVQGGDIISDNNYDTGSLYIEADDCWRIIGPTKVGPQPFNPGGEVAMWVSRDQGRHWKMVRQMTKGSDYNHTYVRRPVDAHPDFYGFWADGHGRKPSDSRLYFCNKGGDVFRLPVKMTAEMQTPEKVN